MGAVFSEADIVIARINDGLVSTAVLTQGAIISVLDKKGNKAFQKLIRGLGGDMKKVDKSPRGEGYIPPGVKKVPTPASHKSKKADLLK